MALYRKKPVEIEAVLWDGEVISETPGWLSDALAKVAGEPGAIMRIGNSVDIFTLEGVMTARPGDYIIRGVKGELYPCKPDIFAATYEAV